MKEISLYCYVGELHALEEEACFDISFGHGDLGSELYVPKIQDLTPQTDLNIHKQKNKLRGLSPHANYTDRAAAAGRRS